MAADTRVTTAGPFYHADKIFRLGVSLFGTAGAGFECLVFMEWLRTTRNRMKLYREWGEDFDKGCIEIIELNPGGIYLWSGWGVREKVNDSLFAVGSGSMVALQAMTDGRTPEEAVKAATKFDEATGPPIQVEYLKQKRKR